MVQGISEKKTALVIHSGRDFHLAHSQDSSGDRPVCFRALSLFLGNQSAHTVTGPL